jgi:hypothetical protein
VIVVVPWDLVVARPAVLTVAAAVEELLHAAEEVTSAVVPSE